MARKVPVDVLDRSLPDRTGESNAGICAADVDLAEVFKRNVEQLLDILRQRDIRGKLDDRRADLLDQLLGFRKALRAYIIDDYLHPALCTLDGDRASDTEASSGND